MAELSEQQQVLKRVSDLVRLAQDGETEEARTAAMQATRLMREHKLFIVPESEIQRIRTVIGDATALAEQHEREGTQKLLIGAVLGALVGRKLF